jgi:O-methyltransferase involved in polyketide biosynthesis
MEEGRPSATAIITATWRAAHLVLDEDPKVFQDPLALRLSGIESEAALQAALEAIQAELARRSTPEIAQKLYGYGRAVVALRQRYTEDELGKAVERALPGPNHRIPLPRSNHLAHDRQ